MSVRILTASLLVAAALAASPARAQTAETDIRAVISEQIEAFKADDFDRAFTYASPTIKRMFGDSDRFGRMVRDGYPMVWRPGSLRFSGLTEKNGRTVQSVLITDEAGALYVVDYEMVTIGGDWQINGVWVRKPGDAGA